MIIIYLKPENKSNFKLKFEENEVYVARGKKIFEPFSFLEAEQREYVTNLWVTSQFIIPYPNNFNELNSKFVECKQRSLFASSPITPSDNIKTNSKINSKSNISFNNEFSNALKNKRNVEVATKNKIPRTSNKEILIKTANSYYIQMTNDSKLPLNSIKKFNSGNEIEIEEIIKTELKIMKIFLQ
jgi:hypothetical protein